MSAIKDGGLLEALNGRRGELDEWLELQSEDEVRAAILALIQPQETLRDHFAAQAAAGLWANQEWMLNAYKQTGKGPHECIAQAAYECADAMLAAREAQP